jgi:hypothetical protein
MRTPNGLAALIGALLAGVLRFRLNGNGGANSGA